MSTIAFCIVVILFKQKYWVLRFQDTYHHFGAMFLALNNLKMHQFAKLSICNSFFCKFLEIVYIGNDPNAQLGKRTLYNTVPFFF